MQIDPQNLIDFLAFHPVHTILGILLFFWFAIKETREQTLVFLEIVLHVVIEKLFFFGKKEFYEGTRLHWSKLFVRKQLIVPKNPDDIPRIIVFLGMARSGSTAFLMLLASLNWVDRALNQIIKGWLRHGPKFGKLDLYGPGQTLMFKENVGLTKWWENYNPVAILIKAGVPAEKILVVIGDKNPARALPSWYHYSSKTTPRKYRRAQKYLYRLYRRYQRIEGLRVVPLVYEELQGRELEMLNMVLDKLNLPRIASLTFNHDRIDRITDWREADEEFNPTYWNQVVNPIWQNNRYAYVVDDKKLRHMKAHAPDYEKRVNQMCGRDYRRFRQQAQKVLEL